MITPVQRLPATAGPRATRTSGSVRQVVVLDRRFCGTARVLPQAPGRAICLEQRGRRHAGACRVSLDLGPAPRRAR